MPNWTQFLHGPGPAVATTWRAASDFDGTCEDRRRGGEKPVQREVARFIFVCSGADRRWPGSASALSLWSWRRPLMSYGAADGFTPKVISSRLGLVWQIRNIIHEWYDLYVYWVDPHITPKTCRLLGCSVFSFGWWKSGLLWTDFRELLPHSVNRNWKRHLASYKVILKTFINKFTIQKI
jgi:hypothetical protein